MFGSPKLISRKIFYNVEDQKIQNIWNESILIKPINIRQSNQPGLHLAG
jgi:hypothetical protein